MKLPPLPGEGDPLAREVGEVAARLGLGARSADLDARPEFPRAEFRALGSAGLLGLRVPVALGGRGLPLVRVGVGLYHLAYHGGTTFAKLALQPEFSSVLGEHGAPALVDRYYRPLLRGECLVGNHVTEPGAGSDAAALAMSAERQGDAVVLTGTKSEAAFAADADAAIVYAREVGAPEAGISAFLVPQHEPGISASVVPDLGERWMRRGTVRYDRVRVPADHRIGAPGRGFSYLKGELTRERALLAAIYLGVARASWEETVRYVGERRAFRRPLSDQQAVAFPLVEDAARLEAAGLFVRRVLERLDAGGSADGDAAIAKWLATDAALVAIDHAVQFHGGRGYSKALPHEQRWRDVRSGAIAHGPSEIMHLVAARELWPRGSPPERGGATAAGPSPPASE